MTTFTRASDSAAPRVFVVEDEALIAMELVDRLSALGYVPCGRASRGDIALARILESQADLVLMDINLVGSMTGIDVAERVREHSEVPIIFLTAYADPELIARAARTQPHGYLTKPFDEREISANIEAALARYAVEKNLREACALLQKRDAETKEINRQLEDALAHVRELRGILPICLACNKIKDDADRWHSLDAYLCAHTDAQLSHGYCPECFEAYMSTAFRKI
jgi:DNA-binding response OmpR family regulator